MVVTSGGELGNGVGRYQLPKETLVNESVIRFPESIHWILYLCYQI